jgi:uncharacterized membrane protein
MTIAIIYLLVGIGVVVAGIVLIGRNRRRLLGSITIFVGLNVILLGYALIRGLGDEADDPPTVVSTPTATE